MTVDSVEAFRQFALLHNGTRLATFLLLHLRTAFFEAHLLIPSKIWRFWFPKIYNTKFSWNPPIPFLNPTGANSTRGGWIFFPDTDTETSRRTRGAHPPPLISFEKMWCYNLGIYGAKIQICGAKIQVHSAKIQIFDTKFEINEFLHHQKASSL